MAFAGEVLHGVGSLEKKRGRREKREERGRGWFPGHQPGGTFPQPTSTPPSRKTIRVPFLCTFAPFCFFHYCSIVSSYCFGRSGFGVHDGRARMFVRRLD